MFNLVGGFQYNIKGRVDLKLGSNFNLNDRINTATLNHCWFLGPAGKKTNKKMWGLNTAYTLLYGKSKSLEEYVSFLSLNFSRDFKICKRFFIKPELGASFRIHTYVKNGYSSGYNIPVIPKFGINLIYSLN